MGLRRLFRRHYATPALGRVTPSILHLCQSSVTVALQHDITILLYIRIYCCLKYFFAINSIQIVNFHDKIDVIKTYHYYAIKNLEREYALTSLRVKSLEFRIEDRGFGVEKCGLRDRIENSKIRAVRIVSGECLRIDMNFISVPSFFFLFSTNVVTLS